MNEYCNSVQSACCCKLKWRPSFGLYSFSFKARFTMFGNVLFKKLLLSSLVKSLSKKFKSPTKISGSLVSSSGSKLTLQMSWIFCIPSISSSVFFVFVILFKCFFTESHQGRSQGSITRAIVLQMQRSYTSSIVILGVVFGILLSSSTMAESKAELQVLQGNSQFTTNLYKVLSEEEGNVFFSPISAHAVLSMAYQGAQGTTAERFASTLQVPQAKAAAEGYNEVMKRLNSVENVTLLMANKIFLMEGAKMLENFTTAVTRHFLSEVQQVNFAQNEKAAKTINSWVEEQTRDKIKDLIQKDDLNELTRLVLVNAIYFKGDWLHKFDKNATKTEPFYLNDADTVDVQMMHIKRKFSYKNDESLNAQVLRLPYKNEDLSMIIILPNERNGIRDLEQKLATVNLTDITNGMWETEVDVALPKFKIEQTIDLKDSLTKLGLGEIFDENKANFRGMIELQPDENLYVSKAVQKAFIEVNEEGAEAAAATAMIMMMRCSLVIPGPTPNFTADHPFLYILSGNNNNNHLFMGRLSKPNV